MVGARRIKAFEVASEIGHTLPASASAAAATAGLSHRRDAHAEEWLACSLPGHRQHRNAPSRDYGYRAGGAMAGSPDAARRGILCQPCHTRDSVATSAPVAGGLHQSALPLLARGRPVPCTLEPCLGRSPYATSRQAWARTGRGWCPLPARRGQREAEVSSGRI